MAQLVIAAAGAAIGNAAGWGIAALGMSGSAVGWAAGSLLGSMIGQPTQRGHGPRLADLSVSGSAYGAPIPYVLGHPRVSSQVIWASTKREIATTTSSGGKGGPKSKYTTYTYEVDLLLLLADNSLGGISRIWSNGKLVYNMLSSGSAASNAASYDSSLWSRLTFYDGDAAQLPDPTYEAAVGTANAPAYRGRSTVFIESLQLGSNGQIPNLTFEVYASGSLVGSGRQPWEDDDYTLLLVHAEGTNGSSSVVDSSSHGRVITVSGGARIATAQAAVGGSSINHVYSSSGYITVNMGGLMLGADFCIELWTKHSSNTMLFYLAGGDYLYNNTFRYGGGSTISIDTTPVDGGWHHFRISREGATLMAWLDGVLQSSATYSGTLDASTITFGRFVPNDNLYFDGYSDEIRVSSVSRGTSTFTPNAALPYDTITLSEGTIQEAVEAICARAGLSASMYDASDLASITKPVRGMAITQVTSARSVLEMLAQCYFFDVVLSDKLYFRPRAGAAVATIAHDDLGASTSGPPEEGVLVLERDNELELPAQMALVYSNVDADYQSDTQYSDRLLTGQKSTTPIEVPLCFTASEAKAIADALIVDRLVASLHTTVAVSMAYARLEAADPVQITDVDGSVYRMRLTRRRQVDGILRCDAVLDDDTVFTQAGISTGGTTPQTVVAGVQDTTLELLDIPILRDADDRPGIYAVLAATEADWPGAALYESEDGTSYLLNSTFSEQAVLGECTTTLANWTGGHVWDEISTLTVDVGLGTLESATRDEVLASQSVNAALVGSELIQFRTAALVSTGIYTLSGLLRGRRGTEWAQTGHAAAERFVLLAASGMRFLELESAALGRLRYYKAATAGQRLSSAVAETITPAGVGLECFSPVDLRADRTTSDTVLTWKRRTRLSTRLVGPLPIYAPLGEASEAYEVDIYADGTYATLKRTLSASSATVTYTSAQQTADFGSGQSVLYCKVYQLSGNVGRGYPLTASA